jgi:hypothetical protein
MNTNIIETLKHSSAGLMMMSESEYPFEVINWGSKCEPLTTQKILQITNHSQDELVEEVELEYFFKNIAFEQEWHDEHQKQEVVKFQTLLNILKNNLKEIQVYRVGTTNIDVYIIGKTSTDELIGLSTKAIET